MFQNDKNDALTYCPLLITLPLHLKELIVTAI